MANRDVLKAKAALEALTPEERELVITLTKPEEKDDPAKPKKRRKKRKALGAGVEPEEPVDEQQSESLQDA